MSVQAFKITTAVIPAKAGIQGDRHRRKRPWIPAFAGMTPWVGRVLRETIND